METSEKSLVEEKELTTEENEVIGWLLPQSSELQRKRSYEGDEKKESGEDEGNGSQEADRLKRLKSTESNDSPTSIQEQDSQHPLTIEQKVISHISISRLIPDRNYGNLAGIMFENF
jgi:hypothetical protein